MTGMGLFLGAQALAFVFLLGAIACALAALSARSLIVMCAGLAACGACAAAAVMALGAGEAALGVALIVAGLAPVLLLGGILLSARAGKARKRGPIVASALAAAVVGIATLTALPELSATPHLIAAPSGQLAPWLAALIFVTAISVLAALGYGERGAFASERER